MATITEDYVSFETVKLLKEKGFDCETDKYYSPKGRELTCLDDRDAEELGYIKRPTLQMARKWLRKVYDLHISEDMVNGGRWKYEIDDISVPFDGGVLPKYYCAKDFSKYEEAIDDAIKYCLDNLI